MRKYTSPYQVYRARPGAGFVSSIYTFPHTLGVEPHIVRVFFECVYPDLGYPVGAVIPVNQHAAELIGTGPFTTAATGYSQIVTPTEVTLSFDTNHGASMHKFDHKKNGRLTNGAWYMVLKMYAP